MATTYTISGSGTGTDLITAVYKTGAAAACPPQTILVAPVACTVQNVGVIWDTVAGAASTIAITKETGTEALGAGVTILAANIDLEGTARTYQARSLSATAASLALAAGERLSVKVATGTATASAGVNFTVILKKT